MLTTRCDAPTCDAPACDAPTAADARGCQHTAIRSAIRCCILVLLLAFALPAVAQDDPLVQRGVPAEATAETAVVARDRALVAGQRLAYERMAASLGMSRGASDSTIEGMVRSMVIESERITARGYAARITVNFNPGRVAAAGGRVPTQSQPPAAEGVATSAAAATPTPGFASGPSVATLDVTASYRSFAEWLEINRRLTGGPVSRVEVVGIAGDQARLRVGLRSQPAEAAAELAERGLDMGPAPGGGGGIDPRTGKPRPGAVSSSEGWRLSLAGGR